MMLIIKINLKNYLGNYILGKNPTPKKTSYFVLRLDFANISTNQDKETLISDMKQYYNGYLFCEESDVGVFNPNMVLYFLDNLIKNKKYPKNMLDLNIKTDYKKLESLAFNFKDEETMESILINEEVEVNLIERFNLEYMYDSKENFISLLFYMGIL